MGNSKVQNNFNFYFSAVFWAICKPRHWNLGIGIGIGTGIGTDITNTIISSSIRPTDTKLCRVVAQDEGISSSKSHDTSTTWSHDKLKNFISLLSQGLWTPNLAGWWLTMRGPHPQNHVTLQYRGHVTNNKRCISTFTRPMDPKLSQFETREPLPTKSRDTSITWLGGKSKTFYLHIHKLHGPQNLVGCWLRMRGPHLKSHVTLQLCGQMENQKRHIFSTTGPSRCKKKACARQK